MTPSPLQSEIETVQVEEISTDQEIFIVLTQPPDSQKWYPHGMDDEKQAREFSPSKGWKKRIIKFTVPLLPS